MAKVETSGLKKWAIRIITFVVIVGFWQIIGSRTNPVILSSPLTVVNALMQLVQGVNVVGVMTGHAFWASTTLTLELMVIGFASSLAIGIPLGLLIGANATLERGLDPYVNALYVTPRAALVPLIIIWFGISDIGVIVIVILSSVFPVIINTAAGVRNIDKRYLDASRAFGVGGLSRFRRVILPGALPYIMAGLRIGLGQAFIGVMIGQMLLAVTGLGYLLTAFGDYFRTPYVMAIIVELAVIGILLTESFKFAERRIAYWAR